MQKAVLFLTFNRLDVVQKSFEQIKLAKPPRFYVASDGARQDVEGEKEKVEQVRKWILDNIDWDCEVKTRFLEKNSGGCGNGVSSAVTWFFENEDDGIILEDDCVANQSFFTFCEELLDKYRDDTRVWHISGDGFYDDKNAKESYYFAKIMHCWGWASWADRWKHFKLDLKDYNKKHLKSFSKRKEVQKYWSKILTDLQNDEIDSWAYPWTFWIIANNGYCINPYKNLVSNIGLEGLHFSADNPLLNMKTDETEKIIHPQKIEFNQKAVDEIYMKYPIKKDKFKFIKKEKCKNKIIVTILGFIKFSYKNKERPLPNKLILGENAVLLKSVSFRNADNHNIVIGKRSMVNCNFIFESDQGEIIIGDRTFINGGTNLISREKIEIGNDVVIAWGVTLYDHNSHSLDYKERIKDIEQVFKDYKKTGNIIANKDWSSVKSRPIKINDKVWIGFDVTILNGVTVGEGAIISAKSVVRKDVEPYTIVAGNPAVKIGDVRA